MEYINQLFYTPYLEEKDVKRIAKKLLKKKQINNLSIIIFRQSNANLIEIISTRELYRLDEREEGVVIIGFAMEREDAFNLVGMICAEVAMHQGDINKITIIKELGL